MEQKVFGERDALTLEEIMASRRDVRGNNFLSKPIEDAVLEKILFAAISAPSVGYSQPWEFVIIRDPSTKDKIRLSFNDENKVAAGLFTEEKGEMYKNLKLEGIKESPLNVAVFYKPSHKTVLGQTVMKEVGLYSVVCAIQNMWLMARALNIGLGWVSILDPEKVKKILHAPDGNQLVAYLCLGYVDKFYERPELELLQWEKKKMLNDVLYLEKYPIS